MLWQLWYLVSHCLSRNVTTNLWLYGCQWHQLGMHTVWYMPNLSNSLFNHSTIETSNLYDTLKGNSLLGSPGAPKDTSSPIHKHCKNQKKHRTTNKNRKPIRVLNINFQSIRNKKPELIQLIDSAKPDIILGTETWLDNNNSSSFEYSQQIVILSIELIDHLVKTIKAMGEYYWQSQQNSLAHKLKN